MKARGFIAIGLIVLIAGTLIYGGCSGEKPKDKVVQPDKPDKPVRAEVQSPSFDADSAFQFIRKQVGFGPRVPNTAAHRNCSDWLVQQLKNYEAVVTTQQAQLTAFDGTMLNAKNIIASFQPEKKERVLLCAHWDTRPFF